MKKNLGLYEHLGVSQEQNLCKQTILKPMKPGWPNLCCNLHMEMCQPFKETLFVTSQLKKSYIFQIKFLLHMSQLIYVKNDH
jgi:hypothetical protein